MKRLGKKGQPLLHQDVKCDIDTERPLAASASDQHENIKEAIQENLQEFQEWVVKKIADCIDDGRAATEVLEERIQHLAGSVAKIEKRVFTVNGIGEDLASDFRGLAFDNNHEINFFGKIVAQDGSEEDRNASIPLTMFRSI